jgi:hypothetical protein
MQLTLTAKNVQMDISYKKENAQQNVRKVNGKI